MTHITPTLVLLTLLPTSALAQNTWYVPGDFPTIQAGIDGGLNGDTVVEATAGASVNLSVKLDHSKVLCRTPGGFDPEKGQKVATVRPKDVYRAIPVYQTIKKEKVNKGTARHAKLMEEATKQWCKALEAVVESGSYVLVVEQGGIIGYPTSDITADIIQAL